MTKNRSSTAPDASRKIDITPLQRLLKMAGPSGAPAIIAAFLDDLKSTDLGLESSWDGPDYAALRLHSHVLIALAGTVGDSELQVIAQRLNTLAHDRDSVKIHAMKGQTMRSLTELMTTLTTLTLTEE